jgi:hypothetical protein
LTDFSAQKLVNVYSISIPPETMWIPTLRSTKPLDVILMHCIVVKTPCHVQVNAAIKNYVVFLGKRLLASHPIKRIKNHMTWQKYPYLHAHGQCNNYGIAFSWRRYNHNFISSSFYSHCLKWVIELWATASPYEGLPVAATYLSVVHLHTHLVMGTNVRCIHFHMT